MLAPPTMSLRLILLLLLCACGWSLPSIRVQGIAADPTQEIQLPNSKEALRQFLEKAKGRKPNSPNDYLSMQRDIRGASKKLLKLLDIKKEPKEYQIVEFDAIAATVALMATEGEDAKKKTLEQIHKFLKDRKTLGMSDINTGLHAAMLLELQPNKKPARDTYELLLDLTKDDSRPDILALRYTIEGSVRRLDLLGKPLPLEATAIDGQKVSIKDLEGKYVLVNFFIRKSKSCEAVVPSLRKYAEKYADELAVVGIAVDQDEAALSKYVADQMFPWPIVHDNAADPRQRLHYKYGVSAFPLVLLLNKVGEVVSLEAHSAELDRIMQMLFEAPTPAPQRTPSSQPPASETKSDSQ